MQPRKDTNRRALGNNLMWFAGSLTLAFFIWMLATLDSDPIQERNFAGIPIQVIAEQGLVVTGQSVNTATVRVRAPLSTLSQLERDDIQVTANLRGLGAGEHRVALEATVSRRAIPDPAPRRITVTLEASQEKLVPVETLITDPLPAGFEIASDGLTVETNQVLISGPQSQVEQVTEALIQLNLRQRRNTFSDDFRLVPVDADGNPVDDITIEPSTVEVSVPIQPRADIKQVSVTPNILVDTLPDSYSLSSIVYSPQVILISGPPEALENAPGTLFTEPIDLTNHTTSFEATTVVQVPDSRLFVIGTPTVQVSIGITPLLSSRQFDRIPIEKVGLAPNYRAESSPSEVTVLITGPQSVVNTLSADNLRVIVDLNGLGAGSHQLTPEVGINIAEGTHINISVLPAEIDVLIVGS
jgi:YbbR domain-containing protein